MLDVFDIMLRNASTGLFLFLAILVLRDYGLRLAAVLGFLSAMTAAMYTVCTHSWYPCESQIFSWVSMSFCIMGPIHIWLFSLSQFQDNFRLKKIHWSGVALYTLLFILNYSSWQQPALAGFTLIGVIFAGLRLFFIVHMIYVAWQGREDDLIETRKRFRSTFIIMVGLYSTVIFIAETFYATDQPLPPYISLIQAGSFFTLALVILWYTTSTKTGLLLIRQDNSPANLSKANATEQHDLYAITESIKANNLYQESGLTISVLAEKVGLPEHRLRRLINQHMGYRNFSEFLNQHRIKKAMTLLSNVDNRHDQILTIAMDLGYGSLGPFNRAFKAHTGKTPTEFRKSSLSAE